MTRCAPGVSSGATRCGSARLTVIATLPSGTGPVGCWSARCPKRDASTISPCEIVLVATSAPVAPVTLVRAPAGTPLATTDCSTRSFWATACVSRGPLRHRRGGDVHLLRRLPGDRTGVGALRVDDHPGGAQERHQQRGHDGQDTTSHH